MRVLYPHIKPYHHTWLSVGDDHEIYVEQCGNPNGEPLLMIHGGPGLGASIDDRCFADPEKFRIILFDQRGCGRSKPHADINNNSYLFTIKDIKQILEFLKIDKVMLFCHHWGVVPALGYAKEYPYKVTKIIATSPFFSRDKDINWLFYNGANLIFPDYYQEFLALLDNENNDVLIDYQQKLFGLNEIVRMDIAKHWLRWWLFISHMGIDTKNMHRLQDTHLALSLSRLQCHYFNQFKINSIADLVGTEFKFPLHIIHGRFDLISPVSNAIEMSECFKHSHVDIVPTGSHSIYEKSMIDAILKSINY